MTHAPHSALKDNYCPREGCSGRVVSTDRVIQTKRKARLRAVLKEQQQDPSAIPVPAPKLSGKAKRTHKAPAAAQVLFDMMMLLHVSSRLPLRTVVTMYTPNKPMVASSVHTHQLLEWSPCALTMK